MGRGGNSKFNLPNRLVWNETETPNPAGDFFRYLADPAWGVLCPMSCVMGCLRTTGCVCPHLGVGRNLPH